MSESPPTADSPEAAAPPGSPPPAAGTPYLLVMPTTEGAPPGLVWPGQEGQPAWAIPVSVPPGTRGFAVFVPLVPPEASEQGAGSAGRPAVTTTTPAYVALPATDGPSTTPTTTPVPATTATGATTPAPTDGGLREGRPVPTQRTEDVPATGPAASSTSAASSDPQQADARTAGVPAWQGGTSQPPAPSTAPPQPGAVPAAAPSGTSPPGAVPAGPASAAFPPGAAPLTPAPPVAWPGMQSLPPRVAPGGFQRQPPRPTFLQTRWPGPKPATGWAAPGAVLAAALGVAAFVPLSRVGIGWFLGGLTLTVAVLVGVRRHTAALPRTERLVRAGWAAAALALLSVLAFRNAWWLVTFCVLGALGCAALAIVGGRLVRSILFSLVATPFAAFRGLPWIRRHVQAAPDAGAVRRVVWSAVATVLVLLVFGGLLSSADAAFSEVLNTMGPQVEVGSLFRGVFLAAVGGLIAVAAVYTLAAPPDLSTIDRAAERRLGILEWAPAIGALTALFGGFVAVQFTVLFGGQRHVLRTAGLSYAEYARSGFWQLLTVTLLTLAVLGGVTRWARRDRPVERVLLRVLLGLLSALSVVIVVSALSRMYTYQKVYSYTGERIFVMAFELLLGAVFLMILAAGMRWWGRWIPGTTVALAVVMLLSLAVLNPEDYAARRNVARYEQTGKIDAWYLRALSADATPALATLPDRVRRCTLGWIDDDLAEPDPWYAWNLGRSRARAELERLGPGAIGDQKDCRKVAQSNLPKTRGTR
ncbi:DUF4153 domain-containing protein [Micromonospora sp. NPDC047548]|uniref:DUF4153 domain-containing protein n=1 Tax=Micromonospora sp. NPDC047548 TaxID=3155624 RepID=UPI003411AC06